VTAIAGAESRKALAIVNGRLFRRPGDVARRDWTAVAFDGGQVVRIGSDTEVLGGLPRDHDVLDAGGGSILPGFVDAHTHWSLCAESVCDSIDVRSPGVESIEQLIARGRAAAESALNGGWLVLQGSSFQDMRLLEGRYPSMEELDQISTTRPVVYKASMHVLIANSAALRALGIGAKTPDPPGGRIGRDAAGEPDGQLLDMYSYLPLEASSDDAFTSALERVANDHMISRGITGVGEITESLDRLRLQAELLRRGLPLKMAAYVWVSNPEDVTEVGELLRNGQFRVPGRLVLGGVKLFVDGGTSSRTAAFYEGYADEPGYAGALGLEESDVAECVRRAEGYDLQVLVHACGDRAQDVALNAFRAATTSRRARYFRHRIEHMGNVCWTDARRSACDALGVLPVPNLGFVTTYGAFWPTALGAERASGCVPLRTMLQQGFLVPASSDVSGADLDSLAPLRNIRSAMIRETFNGSVVGAEEAIELHDAVEMYTRHSALALRNWCGDGALRVGSTGDAVVLSAEIGQRADDSLPADVSVRHTVLDGRLAFSA
jgi:predicted amidohydrolase YtcJ